MSVHKDVYKFKRGQIWMRKVEYETSGSVQSSNRPCLIISNDRGNISQTTVMIAKITSVVPKSHLVINVPFTNDKGQTNIVLCNQVETINTEELVYYLSTVTDELMSKVESAILEAQGMAYEKDIPFAINKVYEVLSRLEVLKANNSETVNKDQEMILDTANKLQELYIDLGKYYEQSAEEIKARIERDPYTQYLVRKELGLCDTEVTNSLNIEDEINNIKEEKKKPRKNTKWTKESMEEFIKDRKTLTLTECTNKWGFENNKSCSQMSSYITKKYQKLYK